MLFSIGAQDKEPLRVEAHPPRRMLYPEEQPQLVREVIDVEVAIADASAPTFSGRLSEPADRAFENLKRELPEYHSPLILVT